MEFAQDAVSMLNLGRKHDLYTCSDNAAIQYQIFKFASNFVRTRPKEIKENEVLWLRGIVPKSMAIKQKGLEIHNAKVWVSEGLTEVIN